MGGEDGGYVYVALATERDCEACLPLVEVCDDGLVELASDVLRMGKCESIKVRGTHQTKRERCMSGRRTNRILGVWRRDARKIRGTDREGAREQAVGFTWDSRVDKSEQKEAIGRSLSND